MPITYTKVVACENNVMYVLRHGESDANVRGVYAGRRLQPPPALTERGHRQAKRAAHTLLGLGGVALIHASGLLRTRQTAEDIADVSGLSRSKIKYDSRIEEYDIGSKTGVPSSYFREHPEWLDETPDAERRAVFVGRVASYISEVICEGAATAGPLLVVTHAGVCRAIELIRQGRDPDELYGPLIPSYANARPERLDLAPVERNLGQYLPQDKTALA